MESLELEGNNSIVTFLQQIGSKMPSSGADAATLRTILLQAGFRSEKATPVFYGVRILSHAGDTRIEFRDDGKDAAKCRDERGPGSLRMRPGMGASSHGDPKRK